MGAPMVAALLGASSKVKLTIGLVFGSRNGMAQRCLANRLLTRALNADQPGCMNKPVFAKVRRASPRQSCASSGTDIFAGTEPFAARCTQAPSIIMHNGKTELRRIPIGAWSQRH